MIYFNEEEQKIEEEIVNDLSVEHKDNFYDYYNEETCIPISKDDITFCDVSGEHVFDLAMEIDKLQQEKQQLIEYLKFERKIAVALDQKYAVSVLDRVLNKVKKNTYE